MDETIMQVLTDETLATNEDKAEALKKGLAKLVIPKDKYNDLSTRLKNTESELATKTSEYEDFKKSKMTEDEKKSEEQKKFEEAKKQNAIERSSLGVQKLLLQNGIEVKDDDTELKETLANIVSEDYDKSIKLATSFIGIMNKTKDQTAKETTTQLLNDTPKPIGGSDSSSSISRKEELINQINEAIKNKDTILQTQLITQLYQEEHKTSNI